MPIDTDTIIRTEKMPTILFNRTIHWVLPCLHEPLTYTPEYAKMF